MGHTLIDKLNCIQFRDTFSDITREISQLKLTERATNLIHKNISKLIESAYKFSADAIKLYTNDEPSEIFEATKEIVLNHVKGFDTQYKRDAKIFSSEYFVKPE